ncbi:MAG: tetratricopeptide repeat protein [Pirellulales bacterium]|nr:tetratricopeptide repeat protein [Pirellulales bacterium]
MPSTEWNDLHMESIDEVLATAMQCLTAGRLAQAEAACRRVLAFEPEHARAWHLLGGIACARGALKEAADCVRRAVALAPNLAEAHGDLGLVLHQMGDLGAAEESYRRLPS